MERQLLLPRMEIYWMETRQIKQGDKRWPNSLYALESNLRRTHLHLAICMIERTVGRGLVFRCKNPVRIRHMDLKLEELYPRVGLY